MLERVFVITADWNPANVKGDAFWRADPTFDQYVGGFPRETDRGFVAEVNGEPVGMVWSRYFTADAPGYGFVSAGIPELGIGIVDGFRGRGIGRGLIETMIAATPAISASAWRTVIRRSDCTALSASSRWAGSARRRRCCAGHPDDSRSQNVGMRIIRSGDSLDVSSA